jgi:hypothetical protein
MLDEYENDVQFSDFIERLERDFMMKHEPDYGYWKAMKKMEWREEKKKRRGSATTKPILKLVSSRPLPHR